MCPQGYIAYGVHLCNKIVIFKGKPENGPARHPALGTGLVQAASLGVASTPLLLLPLISPARVRALGRAAGGAGAKKVYFTDLFKDMFLEAQNEKCS